MCAKNGYVLTPEGEALARRELGIELLWAANGLPEYDVALAAFLER